MVKDLRERIRSGDLEGLDLRGMMIEGNRQFATTLRARYAAMFERITQPENLPALVHCTAGKDRAGFASAVILTRARRAARDRDGGLPAHEPLHGGARPSGGCS